MSGFQMGADFKIRHRNSISGKTWTFLSYTRPFAHTPICSTYLTAPSQECMRPPLTTQLTVECASHYTSNHISRFRFHTHET
ncbi:hypothetical protein AAY473_033855 [Plecturocebus cupreus]